MLGVLLATRSVRVSCVLFQEDVYMCRRLLSDLGASMARVKLLSSLLVVVLVEEGKSELLAIGQWFLRRPRRCSSLGIAYVSN